MQYSSRTVKATYLVGDACRPLGKLVQARRQHLEGLGYDRQLPFLCAAWVPHHPHDVASAG